MPPRGVQNRINSEQLLNFDAHINHFINYHDKKKESWDNLHLLKEAEECINQMDEDYKISNAAYWIAKRIAKKCNGIIKEYDKSMEKKEKEKEKELNG